MKNKIIALLLGFASLNAFSWEVDLMSGYDFLRASQDKSKSIKETKLDGMGFVLGAQIIPIDLGMFEFGAGFEYNFGNKDVRFKDPNGKNTKMFAPFYVLSKLNFYTNNEKKDMNVYGFARLGGVYLNHFYNRVETTAGGVYYGAGLGFNYKYLDTQLLYDGAFAPNYPRMEFEHKLGLRLGLRLGSHMMPRVQKIKKDDDNVKTLTKTNTVVKEKIIYRNYPIISDLVIRQNSTISDYDIQKLADKNSVPYKFDLSLAQNVDTTKLGAQKIKANIKFDNGDVKEILIDANVVPEILDVNCNSNKCIIKGFGFDKSVGTLKMRKSIRNIVSKINSHLDNVTIDVIGHTDNYGKIAYNYELGYNRASWLVKELTRNGLKKSIKIGSIASESELSPIDTNSTKIGRFNNRRVEIIIRNIENK